MSKLEKENILHGAGLIIKTGSGEYVVLSTKTFERDSLWDIVTLIIARVSHECSMNCRRHPLL